MSEEVFERGRYIARLARGAADLGAAQALRYRAFIDPRGGGRDRDRFDAACTHLLVETEDGALVATCRLLSLASGAEIGRSYAAQFYDLARLEAYPGRMLEMGRFCIRPGLRDGEILRTAWAMLTRLVDRGGVEMLFGCSSFPGTDPGAHLAGFAMLRARSLAPARWAPGEKAAELFRFAGLSGVEPSLRAVPPLLRTYLAMGGWVSDHAVIDRALGTLHVFTGLEVAAVPASRARALRAAAHRRPRSS